MVENRSCYDNVLRNDILHKNCGNMFCIVSNADGYQRQIHKNSRSEKNKTIFKTRILFMYTKK
jgi:hypothetical protein